jgi:cell division protein FtsB
MNIWVMIYRICWVLLLILCIIGLTCVFVPKTKELWAHQERREQIKAENRQMMDEIEELKANQERFQNDPAYVEHIARLQGMVKEGEVVYKSVSHKNINLAPLPGNR